MRNGMGREIGREKEKRINELTGRYL
jgi:hypothetical protein